MSLAIDGNTVHGIARSGTAFVEAGAATLTGQKVSGIKSLSKQDYYLEHFNEDGKGILTFKDASTDDTDSSIDPNYSDTGTVLAHVKTGELDAVLIICDSNGMLAFRPSLYFGNIQPAYKIWVKTSSLKWGGVKTY